MKPVLVVMLVSSIGLISDVVAKPTLLGYASQQPAPVGPDGRVVDTPEVVVAKSQHAAAQLNERVNLAREAAKSDEDDVAASPPAPPSQPQPFGRILVSGDGSGLTRILTNQDIGLTLGVPLTLAASLVPGTPAAAAPVGPDGRVVDTPAVALAKAEHAVAHLNEKLQLANEATRNSALITISASPAIGLRL